MCGRFALSLSHQEFQTVARELVGVDQEWDEDDAASYREVNYNVAPQTRVPVIWQQNHYTQQQSQTKADEELTNSTDAVDDNEEVKACFASAPIGIKVMKWGLIPHWMKSNSSSPTKSSTALKTINARDDNVLSGTGMWASLRGKKRCIVLADGFYEWQRKPSSNEKTPFFVKRKDGKFMTMAGLWDYVKYEGSDQVIYSFTVITTDNCRELEFLHDRMPLILDNKQDISRWLNTSSQKWDKNLSHLLKPYDGSKLEYYAVPGEVGKVGNNSPDFVKPVSQRKGNLASFFAKQTQNKEGNDVKEEEEEEEEETKQKLSSSPTKRKKIKGEEQKPNVTSSKRHKDEPKSENDA